MLQITATVAELSYGAPREFPDSLRSAILCLQPTILLDYAGKSMHIRSVSKPQRGCGGLPKNPAKEIDLERCFFLTEGSFNLERNVVR